LGPFGISVEVADLETALKVVQQGTHKKLAIQPSGRAISFIVPPDLAAGTFFEFVQQ
jgi:hypothetical protein